MGRTLPEKIVAALDGLAGDLADWCVSGRDRTLAAHEEAVLGLVRRVLPVLLRALRAGGADVALCASNPLSTKDEACAALVEDEGVAMFAWQGENLPTYQRHLEAVLATDPHLLVDDGADLIAALHQRPDHGSALAGIEETTTGVARVGRWPGRGTCGSR